MKKKKLGIILVAAGIILCEIMAWNFANAYRNNDNNYWHSNFDFID